MLAPARVPAHVRACDDRRTVTGFRHLAIACVAWYEAVHVARAHHDRGAASR
jgi:hypothetical protein